MTTTASTGTPNLSSVVLPFPAVVNNNNMVEQDYDDDDVDSGLMYLTPTTSPLYKAKAKLSIYLESSSSSSSPTSIASPLIPSPPWTTNVVGDVIGEETQKLFDEEGMPIMVDPFSFSPKVGSIRIDPTGQIIHHHSPSLTAQSHLKPKLRLSLRDDATCATAPTYISDSLAGSVFDDAISGDPLDCLFDDSDDLDDDDDDDTLDDDGVPVSSIFRTPLVEEDELEDDELSIAASDHPDLESSFMVLPGGRGKGGLVSMSLLPSEVHDVETYRSTWYSNEELASIEKDSKRILKAIKRKNKREQRRLKQEKKRQKQERQQRKQERQKTMVRRFLFTNEDSNGEGSCGGKRRRCSSSSGVWSSCFDPSTTIMDVEEDEESRSLLLRLREAVKDDDEDEDEEYHPFRPTKHEDEELCDFGLLTKEQVQERDAQRAFLYRRVFKEQYYQLLHDYFSSKNARRLAKISLVTSYTCQVKAYRVAQSLQEELYGSNTRRSPTASTTTVTENNTSEDGDVREQEPSAQEQESPSRRYLKKLSKYWRTKRGARISQALWWWVRQ